MTVLEAIQKSTEFLVKKNVESPRLQAELLLAHLLKMPRMKLYLNFDRALSSAETDLLREHIKRRGQREPLQHIVGSTSFCGHEIAVDHSSLVTALDFGTGTGCIAIALAAKCPAAKIVATDISADALALAKENAAKNDFAERIEFLQGDGFAPLTTKTRFDLLISNPPYIASAEIETLAPEVKDFDPRGALDGGADGLDFYRRLAVEAKPLLKPDGKIMLEFGDGQVNAIKNIFENEKWIVEAVQDDYSQRARILIAHK